MCILTACSDRFAWRSLGVLYSTVVIVALLISIGFAFSCFIGVGITFTTSGTGPSENVKFLIR